MSQKTLLITNGYGDCAFVLKLYWWMEWECCVCESKYGVP